MWREAVYEAQREWVLANEATDMSPLARPRQRRMSPGSYYAALDAPAAGGARVRKTRRRRSDRSRGQQPLCECPGTKASPPRQAGTPPAPLPAAVDAARALPAHRQVIEV